MKAYKIGVMMIALLAVLLSGCKSSRNMISTGSTGALSEREYVEKVIAHTPQTDCISAKMRFALKLGTKDFSIGGNLRMQKDEIIQLSLVGFGIIEGGRIEFTKDSVLLLDRIHHQYLSARYDELSFLREAQVDFYTLQALFWNELIVPGKQHVTLDEAADFKVSRQGDDVVLAGHKGRKLAYRFLTSCVDGLLKRTEILSNSQYQLNWNYADFVNVGKAQYPSLMNIELAGANTTASVTLSLSRIAADAGKPSPTQVSKRYTKVEVSELLEKLLKM